ncbi:MAG TPA: TetR/AcrR family transcriptional regulator [Acidimicrobiales bacterium]|jgi:AcrR family transcriptional regulator|nr:TetR/AcrR family transcriptional regulator [Acidimicrobiales bacterium]
MSEAVAVLATGGAHQLEATRRRLTPRQAEVVMALVRATEAEVEEVGYPGLTVRSVARRAGVAPATAYNYFSSKDHLLSEVLWRRMQHLTPVEPADGRPMKERLTDAVRAMVFTTESAALVDACTVALLSPNPDVKHLRDRIGAAIHRRLTAAVGPEADPIVIRVLETTFSGALLAAGMGHMESGDIPGFVADAAALMVGRTRGGPSR